MEDNSYPIEKYKNRALIINEKMFFSRNLVTLPLQYHKYIDDVILPYGALVNRIEKLAYDILEDNRGHDIILVTIMKSSLMFSNYLQKYIMEIKKYKDFQNDVFYEYITSTSYVDSTSTGETKILTSLDVFKSFKGKNIIIIEDMYDSGTSLNYLIELIQKYEPKSIKIAMLCIKQNPKNLKYNLNIDYVGFIIPRNTFVLGFGMDYNELFRDLNHMCVCSEEGQKLLNDKFEINKDK